jgi:hypothetical protein
VVHKDKVETWISKGAQPSEQVASLLRSLNIPTQVASRPVAASPAAEDKPAAKRVVKRAKPRVVSPRKLRARAARKAGKKQAVKAV